MKARIKETGEIVEVYHEAQYGTPKIIYKESVFVNSRMWTEDELDFNFDENPLDDKFIYKFNGKYKLAKYPPKEDGYYMTIRCGLSGIYTCVNVWKDNKWQVEAADASDTIAYSKELISKETVDTWVKKKLEKYHNELK